MFCYVIEVKIKNSLHFTIDTVVVKQLRIYIIVLRITVLVNHRFCFLKVLAEKPMNIERTRALGKVNIKNGTHSRHPQSFNHNLKL